MPEVYHYLCSNCKIKLPRCYGYYLYVEDDSGKRIECYHPGEEITINSVLGKNASEKLREERVGFNSYCICLDCLKQFEADLDIKKNGTSKDPRECPKCKSSNISTLKELAGQQCPKCKKGKIIERWTGIIT